MNDEAAEIRRVAGSLQIVLGHSAEGRIASAKCREALDEMETVGEDSSTGRMAIAVLGSKNTGKSWLCRFLVRDEELRHRIPCGETSGFATAKATWIGPEVPAVLDPEYESRVPVRQERMVDLGSSYVLLDLPGFDDATVESRAAALMALRGVPLRILMVSTRTMDAESQFGFLEASDGTRILPVVVDDNFPQLEEEDPAALGALVQRVRRHCPQADVLEPVVIPHFLHAPGQADEKNRVVENRLLPALERMLAAPPPDPRVLRVILLERLRRRLGGDLRGFVARVGPAHGELEAVEERLAGELVQRILGTDDQLEAGLRMRIRFLALARIPVGFVPFRGVYGLLVLTAGAWDRLALAMGGSVPSLALLAYQGAKNARRMSEMRVEMKNALAERIEGMARDELVLRNEIFVRSINSSLAYGSREDRNTPSAARFAGLDRVTGESDVLFADVVRRKSGGMLGLVFWGGLATLLFAGLLAGPLLAVYREFIAAWFGAVGEGSRWGAFPAPSAGMIFTSLLLAVFPVIVCATICCVRTTPHTSLQTAVAETRALHGSMLERLTGEGAIRFVSDDPLREAVRHLLNFLRGVRQPRHENPSDEFHASVILPVLENEVEPVI